MSFSLDDSRHMRRALALARLGLGRVEPNPQVGCVLVSPAGQVIGEGYHGRFGGPHAEAAALLDAHRAGVSLENATAYVTLEPCCAHPGKKTTPCANALIAAGIKRVVVATGDPFAGVNGAGLAQLRAAGLAVETGLLETEAQALNEVFFKRCATGLPWVALKWAQTLDGRTATLSGDSQWISNDISRLRVHELRAICDAVMVGIGTALADDPLLTARGVEVKRVARRVVVDPALKLPDAAALLHDGGPPVLIACDAAHADSPRAQALRARGVEILGLPQNPALRADGAKPALQLRPLFAHLSQLHAASRVLVEGGAGLAGHLLRQNLVDQCLVFVAPKVLGQGAPPAYGPSVEKMAQALPLHLHHVERMGDDVMLDYRLAK